MTSTVGTKLGAEIKMLTVSIMAVRHIVTSGTTPSLMGSIHIGKTVDKTTAESCVLDVRYVSTFSTVSIGLFIKPSKISTTCSVTYTDVQLQSRDLSQRFAP